MITASIRARLAGFVGVLCLAVLAGCATTATLTTQRPAESPVFGHGRVAIMKFGGSADDQGVIRQVVADQLAHSGLVPLMHGDQLQQFASVPLYRSNGHLKREVALEAARRGGADSLLLGQLHHIEPDGTIWGQKSFRFGDPSILAVIQYELVDVRSGNVVLDGRVESSTYKGEFDSKGRNSESEVLGRLTREAAQKLARRLVPYEEQVPVTLASPGYGKESEQIREGNQAASRGDWQAAANHWADAVRVNPESHAALFNLGLAQEALRDYAAAERNVTGALALSDRSTYREALERIRRSSLQHHEALAQRASVGSGHSQLARRLPPAPLQPVAAWNAGEPAGPYPPAPSPALPGQAVARQANVGQANVGQAFSRVPPTQPPPGLMPPALMPPGHRMPPSHPMPPGDAYAQPEGPQFHAPPHSQTYPGPFEPNRGQPQPNRGQPLPYQPTFPPPGQPQAGYSPAAHPQPGYPQPGF